jgi:SAM-dependent methyltransferase
MPVVDAATAEFYSRQASEIAARYESVASPVARFFGTAFATGSRVLDVGAGSGRDLGELLASGYDAYGVEPSEALAALAVVHHPELTGRIARGALPQIGEPFGGGFDGILCSAVLMHVPEADLFDTVFALRQLLRPHGRLLLSLPLSRGDVDGNERGIDGRLFTNYAPEYLQLLLERVGFQQIGRWDGEDALARAGTRWYTLLFELRSTGALRAVDQIEGILNRDKKVASYKLALFRALAELAIQEPRCATWRPDGRVGVPIRRLAEKWLLYFWPIFASSRFIPQSQSEGAGSTKPVMFRKAMATLMAPYQGSGDHGGLTAWHLDLSAGRLGVDAKANLAAALRSIAQAIRLGPVQYAGGALETGTVFEFDSASAQVLMSSELWRELSLLGHWINDAVILRWAELTERFGQRLDIRSGDVLPLLLARPEPERATRLARDAFLKHGVDRCAWSDRRLNDAFAVDHVIPYSLWGNNDLWNLLPVHPVVNGQKSDRLPAADLVRVRQPQIVGGWQVLRDAVPVAFDQQATHLLGRPMGGPLKWEDELFARLREAIELTALQRGVERWRPRLVSESSLRVSQ